MLLYALLIFIGCGEPTRDKLANELYLTLADEAQHRMEEANYTYLRIYQWAQNESWPETTQAEARKYIQQSNIDEAHAIATRFYGFAKAFMEAYESTRFPQEELLNRYTLSFDSIVVLVSEPLLVPTDYSHTEQIKHLPLVVQQMMLDMAVLEDSTMKHLQEMLPTIIHDEFPNWGADTLRVMGYWYKRIEPSKP